MAVLPELTGLALPQVTESHITFSFAETRFQDQVMAAFPAVLDEGSSLFGIARIGVINDFPV
jgi:hypothetical protein